MKGRIIEGSGVRCQWIVSRQRSRRTGREVHRYRCDGYGSWSEIIYEVFSKWLEVIQRELNDTG